MTITAGTRVEAHSVSRSFSGAGPERVAAVEDVSLVLEPGEFVAVSGRSGSGKTVLLSILGGLDRPTSGSVRHNDFDLATMSRAERTSGARSTGVVFQNAAVIRRSFNLTF